MMLVSSPRNVQIGTYRLSSSYRQYVSTPLIPVCVYRFRRVA